MGGGCPLGAPCCPGARGVRASGQLVSGGTWGVSLRCRPSPVRRGDIALSPAALSPGTATRSAVEQLQLGPETARRVWWRPRPRHPSAERAGCGAPVPGDAEAQRGHVTARSPGGGAGASTAGGLSSACRASCSESDVGRTQRDVLVRPTAAVARTLLLPLPWPPRALGAGPGSPAVASGLQSRPVRRRVETGPGVRRPRPPCSAAGQHRLQHLQPRGQAREVARPPSGPPRGARGAGHSQAGRHSMHQVPWVGTGASGCLRHPLGGPSRPLPRPAQAPSTSRGR